MFHRTKLTRLIEMIMEVKEVVATTHQSIQVLFIETEEEATIHDAI